MAITIRDTEKHEKMLTELKALTNKATASGSLIEGGYMSVKYHAMYTNEKKRNEQLTRQLNELERKVQRYFFFFYELRPKC